VTLETVVMLLDVTVLMPAVVVPVCREIVAVLPGVVVETLLAVTVSVEIAVIVAVCVLDVSGNITQSILRRQAVITSNYTM